MTALWFTFDLILISGILYLAWASLSARDGFKMIVLFMVLGLLVALAWVRLRAPDIALAEAAIGAGLTGALFLNTLRHVQPRSSPGDGVAMARPSRRLVSRLMVAPLIVLVTAALGAALMVIPRPAPSLFAEVDERMPQSGVENPVTAVLLNFRGYDTLLEVVVLLVAVVCVWLVTRSVEPRQALTLGPVFLGFSRLALPAMVVIAAYLLWLGAFAPGGAFQGAAMLAAVGILLLLGRLAPPAADRWWSRLTVAGGTAVFAGAAMAAAALGRDFLEYPPTHAKTWIIVIEAALTVSIAATLVALFHGAAPAPAREARRP